MKTRRQKILESGYQIQYKVFLLNNKKEPFPGTPEWKNNIPFMEWVGKIQGKFRKENNLSDHFPIIQRKEWEEILKFEIARYIKPSPPKTRYGSKKKLKPVPENADENYFIQEELRIQKKIERIKKTSCRIYRKQSMGINPMGPKQSTRYLRSLRRIIRRKCRKFWRLAYFEIWLGCLLKTKTDDHRRNN